METQKITLPDELKLKLLERFLCYTRVNTQSSDNPADDDITIPRQKKFLAMVAKELREIGCQDVTQFRCGYVFATVPGSGSTVGFLAHADTYPGTSGALVVPQVTKNYDGEDITLPGTGEMIMIEDNPDLPKYKGTTVITSDGNTLLGADDKAGIAEIVTAAEYLIKYSNELPPHATLCLCFTTNEEVGRGTEHFDEALLEDFGADFAFTVDGSALGEIEDETFSADTAIVTIKGHDVHPGYAKGKMVNAVRALAHLIDLMDKDFLPETTEGRQSYLHPIGIDKGDVNQAGITFIVRAFTEEELHAREEDLQQIIEIVKSKFPGIEINLEIKEGYRNMKQVLDQHPHVMTIAFKALQLQGIEPICKPIRGGTDGSELSRKGLPTPNLFAGGRNFHSTHEWVPVVDMEAAVEVIAQIAVVSAEELAS